MLLAVPGEIVFLNMDLSSIIRFLINLAARLQLV